MRRGKKALEYHLQDVLLWRRGKTLEYHQNSCDNMSQFEKQVNKILNNNYNWDSRTSDSLINYDKGVYCGMHDRLDYYETQCDTHHDDDGLDAVGCDGRGKHVAEDIVTKYAKNHSYCCGSSNESVGEGNDSSKWSKTEHCYTIGVNGCKGDIVNDLSMYCPPAVNDFNVIQQLTSKCEKKVQDIIYGPSFY